MCASAGATVQLADSCWATRAGATLTYEVDGQPATSAVCPAAGTPLAVKVKAQLTSKPGCVFAAADAFSLVSEWPRRYLFSYLGARLRLAVPGLSSVRQLDRGGHVCCSSIIGAARRCQPL